MNPKAGHSKQRRALLEHLASTDRHPTAADLVEALAAQGDPVSLSNLYRNLEILVASGLLRRLSLDGGPDRFDANLGPHYHVVCTDCHRLWDMPIREGDRFGLSLPKGFRPSSWEITVRGRCAACAKALHPYLSKEV
jgi:Fur family transcriptional regulator, peroxide stress response regulator